MIHIKYFIKNLFLTVLGLIVALLMVEILLHFYNPFQFRVKGFSIVLPANKKIIINNDTMPKLDKTIIHTKNTLGFRGEEPQKDFVTVQPQ
jgi:hypothetical protein